MRYLTAIIMYSLFIIGCKTKAEFETINEDLIPVTTISLQQDTVFQEINTSGQFTTDEESNLSFKSGGIISRVFVQEGDAIRKGQLLATLNLTELNALAEQANLAYQKAKRDYERAGNLYRDSVATLEQMQNAKTAMDLARQQYTSAGFNQQYAEIRAVRNGFVLRKFLNEGQYAAAGTPVLQTNGAAEKGWILKTGVSDRQWAALKPGDAAVITTDALPGTSIKGTIWKKSEGIDPVSGTFNIQIKLSESPKSGIASGLFGKAVIRPAQKTLAWSIPYDALLDGSSDSGFVFATNDNKTVQKVKVGIGSIEKDYVTINSGLENVKAVIVSGSAYLNEGSQIRIANR
ncbi:efflux RND transporter periplasmic adaptor subunit [Pollutibacter soli]|uniref:efflux RND transporter periplasmic adaptor subunit n=1 Tax=Pollutibacter soli TaxID=3034157 RepID=UPI0030133A3F